MFAATANKKKEKLKVFQVEIIYRNLQVALQYPAVDIHLEGAEDSERGSNAGGREDTRAGGAPNKRVAPPGGALRSNSGSGPRGKGTVELMGIPAMNYCYF